MESKEERKRRLSRERQLKYRLKKGDTSVGLGQLKKGEVAETEVIGKNIIIHNRRKDDEDWMPRTDLELTKNSKLEDLLPWALEVAEQLKQSPAPAAWASALNSVLKIIEHLDKKLPQVLPTPKPRPRQIIEIEENEVIDED